MEYLFIFMLLFVSVFNDLYFTLTIDYFNEIEMSF